MADKKVGGGSGGSSQNNGANERASDAASSVGLDKGQQEQLQRELEDRGENLTYKEIREIAEEIKKELRLHILWYDQNTREFFYARRNNRQKLPLHSFSIRSLPEVKLW